MKPALDILSFGEPLIEFNQTGDPSGSAAGRHWLQGFGGDSSNFAIAAARQGARVGVMGALGADVHGASLRALWRAEGIDAAAVKTDSAAPTGLYFVTHGAAGHEFHFHRAGSAASRYAPADLDVDAIQATRVLHLSGITLAISDTARAAGFEAMALARRAGVEVSFDTNLRLKLWPLKLAQQVIGQALRQCDFALPSLDDIQALTGIAEPDALVDHCLGLGARIVALKLGAAGALVATGSERHRIAPFACTPVDATGAGDCFGGAFVARILAGDALLDAGRYAAAAAALSTQGYGAVEPIPRVAAVRALLT
jgi:2-dehydro-3-deoxygluconokinase